MFHQRWKAKASKIYFCWVKDFVAFYLVKNDSLVDFNWQSCGNSRRRTFYDSVILKHRRCSNIWWFWMLKMQLNRGRVIGKILSCITGHNRSHSRFRALDGSAVYMYIIIGRVMYWYQQTETEIWDTISQKAI